MTSTPTKDAMARSIALSSDDGFGVLEHVRGQPDARRGEPIAAPRTDSCRPETTQYFAVLAEARSFEEEDVLHRDHLALHPGDLGDPGHLAGAIGETRDLHDQIDCGGDLLPDRLLRNIQIGHRDHRVEPVQRIA